MHDLPDFQSPALISGLWGHQNVQEVARSEPVPNNPSEPEVSLPLVHGHPAQRPYLPAAEAREKT